MKIVINFCPTGMVPTKKQNFSVPIHPQEIIEEVHHASELGITIAHLHARNPDETPAYQKNVYREIFEGVRKHCPELVICGSSSGRNFPEFEKRSEVLELHPDMCSLTLSSLNFMNQASVNAPDMVQQLAQKMVQYGVHPELECFDLGMINYGKYLIKKELVKGPFYWNLLFGNIAGMQATLMQIGTAISELHEPGHFIALAGLGTDQLKVNAAAVAFDLGIRIGLEDNLWFDEEKTIPATNIKLLKRIHNLLAIHGKSFMHSKEFGAFGFYNEKNIYSRV